MSAKRLIVHEDEEPPREGGCGHIIELVNPKTSGTQNIDIATVIIDPGKKSDLHYHKRTEEIYYIIHGKGKMHINDLEFDVRAGHDIYIPTGAKHTIKNTGSSPLVFVVAASPPFDLADVYY